MHPTFCGAWLSLPTLSIPTSGWRLLLLACDMCTAVPMQLASTLTFLEALAKNPMKHLWQVVNHSGDTRVPTSLFHALKQLALRSNLTKPFTASDPETRS